MNPLDFLRRTLSDARATPDAKLLLLAGIGSMIVAQFPIGWLTGRWIPEYILAPTYLFLAAGFGLDTFTVAQKIAAETAVTTAEITGQQPPAVPAPATATTTTQTTISTD
jgi:hypothetical protein